MRLPFKIYRTLSLSLLVSLTLFAPLRAEIVEIRGTGITFDAPDEFAPVPQHIIEAKWPNRNAPAFVVGNQKATTTIAYDLKPQNLSGVPMEDVRASFESVFNRVVPGIRWEKNEVIQHEGQDWVFLEMTSNAIDTDIYNIMMVTSFEDKMLVFNFNSTKQDFPRYETELRRSLKSVKLPKGPE